MQPKVILLALASVLTTGLLLYLVFGGHQPIPLLPLETAPRPPVKADKQTKPQLLSGLLEPYRAEHVTDVINGKRRRRNQLAQDHAEALLLWRAGKQSLRRVEAIEEMLVVAREHTGEISTQEMHEQLIVLFEREVARVEALQAQGFAGTDNLERARLYLARELYLAGHAGSDARAASYPQDRVSYLAAVKRRHDTLVASRLGKRAYLQLEYEDLERDFAPPPEPAGSAPR